MNWQTILGILIAVIASHTNLIHAHPTVYPHVIQNYNQAHTNPPILSWHVHIIFTLWPDDVQGALELRNRTILQFQDYLGEDCHELFDQGRLCMFKIYDWAKVSNRSPFPAGEWSIFVPDHMLLMVSKWMRQNRGEYSMLVHPNSGYTYLDHTDWALWGGQPWVLNTKIFGDPSTKHGEEDHYPGDSQNPICAAANDVCGDSERGETLMCCTELACLQKSGELLYRCQ